MIESWTGRPTIKTLKWDQHTPQSSYAYAGVKLIAMSTRKEIHARACHLMGGAAGSPVQGLPPKHLIPGEPSL